MGTRVELYVDNIFTTVPLDNHQEYIEGFRSSGGKVIELGQLGYYRSVGEMFLKKHIGNLRIGLEAVVTVPGELGFDTRFALINTRGLGPVEELGLTAETLYRIAQDKSLSEEAKQKIMKNAMRQGAKRARRAFNVSKFSEVV